MDLVYNKMFKILLLFITVVFGTSLYAAWGDSSNKLYGVQKYSFEDSVVHSSMLQCKDLAKAGGNKPEIFQVNIGNNKQIILNYQTFTAKDVIIVEYDNQTIYNSGCKGTGTWERVRLNTDGFRSDVTIKVHPNCSGKEPGTRWEFFVDCN